MLDKTFLTKTALLKYRTIFAKQMPTQTKYATITNFSAKVSNA